MNKYPKLAVLVSGTGSILEAFIEKNIVISLVVADRECRGLKVASDAGIKTELIERDDFGPGFDRNKYTQKIVDTLKRSEIDLVAMAGFMTILGSPVFEAYENHIYNTHPSLLPAFRGDNAVQAALDYGVKISGCTIHIATMELDAGPIIAQAAVPVEPGDDKAALHERIKQVERQLYPMTIHELMSS